MMKMRSWDYAFGFETKQTGRRIDFSSVYSNHYTVLKVPIQYKIHAVCVRNNDGGVIE